MICSYNIIIRCLIKSCVVYLLISGQYIKAQNKAGHDWVKVYTDPATNDTDPEKRMAYGLNVAPPWPNGGYVFINLPEHLEYMPGTKGIARHHDMRTNVWQVNDDSTEAHYSVESLTEPGVFFSAIAKADSCRINFEFTITNHTNKQLQSVRPLFCFQYHSLSGFPKKFSDNFSHTYIIIDDTLSRVSDLPVTNPTTNARMAQVADCADEHNWWAEKAGGMIQQKITSAYTILTDTAGYHKLIVHWSPGKNFLSNSAIPCVHADPCIGNIEPGKAVKVSGSLTFTILPLNCIF